MGLVHPGTDTWILNEDIAGLKHSRYKLCQGAHRLSETTTFLP